jgi:hypothetical protein
MSPNDETRQRQVMLTLASLIILVMAGFVAGSSGGPN